MALQTLPRKKWFITTAILLKIVSVVVWTSAIICFTIVFRIGFNKTNFSKAFSTAKQSAAINTMDSMLLNYGDINFSDKKSFVVDAFRYQGTFEQLPEKININEDRQKLYNYIYQRKIKQPTTTKPTKPDDFSIKSLSNP